MNVTQIKIKNILGIEDLTITPGAVTKITGKNGSGKTSTLEAIKAALKGGHDATLLRNGAEKGEVVILFDDGGQITKTITADRSEVKVRQDGRLVKNAATALDELRDAVSVNPIEFLTADRKRRLQILLESIHFDITDEQLSDAAGFQCRVGSDALAMVDTVRKGVFDERTGINRAIKEKANTIDQLSQSVPQNVVGDVDAELAKMQTVDIQLNEAMNLEISKVNQSEAERIQKLRDEIEGIQKWATEQRDSIKSLFHTKIAPVIERRTQLQEQLKNKAAFEQQKKVIEDMEAGLESLNEELQQKNEALDRIDVLKASMLETLPIPGMTIQDGDIFIEDVPFDRLNNSNQIKVCMQLAAQRAGDLKLICVDGLEALDQERFDRFVEAAKTTGCQFIVTRVTSNDFAVEAQ